jgi:hypothetical protein
MIVVKIELWPHGREVARTEIGRLYIANMGGDAEIGHYKCAAVEERELDRGVPWPIDMCNQVPCHTGSVTDYPRQKLKVFCLVERALRAMGFR